MSDAFNVTAAWSKSSYAAGETITGTISGGDVETTTTTTQQTVGPVTIPIVAEDGATSTVDLPATQVTVTSTTSTPRSVVIDTAAFNPNQGGRTWTVSADKLRITATA